MKIALVVNEQTPDVNSAIKILTQMGYTILKSVIPDEIAQAGKQATKIILVFDDAKFAYKFCGENKWTDFDSLKILYLNRKPILTPEVTQKLSSVGLNLFTPADEQELKDKILSFEDQSDDTMELKFSIIDDLENEK